MSTSYGDIVRDPEISVSVLTPQGVALTYTLPVAPNLTLPSGIHLVGITTTTSIASGGSFCSMRVSMHYSDGTTTQTAPVVIPCPDVPLDSYNRFSSGSRTNGPCPELEGEIGVNTLDLTTSIVSRIGINQRSSEALWLHTAADLDQLLALDWFLKENTGLQAIVAPEAKEFGQLAVVAWKDNGEVDFVEEIIYLENILNYPCQTELIKQANSETGVFCRFIPRNI